MVQDMFLFKLADGRTLLSNANPDIMNAWYSLNMDIAPVCIGKWKVKRLKCDPNQMKPSKNWIFRGIDNH